MQHHHESIASESPRRRTPLYRHVKRQDWGLAILAWERDGHRAYQFEDGELRVFADGFYALLEPVDRPGEEGEALATRLAHEVTDSDARRDLERKLVAGDPGTVPFEQQVALFRARFPLGFADPEWKRGFRGQQARRRLKRHRDAAIARAQDVLGDESLERLIAQKQYGVVIDLLVATLMETDLVTASQIAPLRDVAPDNQKGLAIAIRTVLHGTAPYGIRFTQFMKAIRELCGVSPSWQLVTAPNAIVHPLAHICVRPSVFCEQARTLAPRLATAKTPGPSRYARFLAMAEHIRGKLNEQGLGTRDLMDVHDFMRVTLTPAARKTMTSSIDEDDADTDTDTDTAA